MYQFMRFVDVTLLGKCFQLNLNQSNQIDLWMQLSVYVVVAILAKDVWKIFVLLLSTAAHGSAIQGVWCSKQRSRGFDCFVTTLCVLSIPGLHLFTWILHWHSGFSHLAGSHISCLTDLSWTPSPAAFLQTFDFPIFGPHCVQLFHPPSLT